MHLLRLLWFLLRNLHFENKNDEAHLWLRGLHLALDAQGNVRLWSERDLRLNARFVMTQCTSDFEPAQPEAQAAPPVAGTIEPLYRALVRCLEAEASKAPVAGGCGHDR
ncbi:hypothetical protein [Gloeobacter kilaueensis]|uniref:Uncharacterized protein n=1 Tax=Gloeobacter kilaueensis (strain ATCC BAA-2537 / CCAP 1431/1 / ULC 316 / JS1) TaxID=1183438 RepID=U5QC67_GLOK1|nr:hypothetical protein [Gloeobacter kilaueensis]AGY56446.1 hypothetical protein GKIL_0199 [Gloeobacter kilaueensis JS1]